MPRVTAAMRAEDAASRAEDAASRAEDAAMRAAGAFLREGAFARTDDIVGRQGAATRSQDIAAGVEDVTTSREGAQRNLNSEDELQSNIRAFERMHIGEETVRKNCHVCKISLPYPFGITGFPVDAVSCPICFEDTKPIMVLGCGHFICPECFTTCFGQTEFTLNDLLLRRSQQNRIDEERRARETLSTVFPHLFEGDENSFVPFHDFDSVFAKGRGKVMNPLQRRANTHLLRMEKLLDACDEWKNSNLTMTSNIVKEITFYCNLPEYVEEIFAPDVDSDFYNYYLLPFKLNLLNLLYNQITLTGITANYAITCMYKDLKLREAT